jgi:hypothetical protein
MTDPFSRTSRLTPQQWKLRARVIQAHLERLSLDELMRGGRVGEAPHLGVGSSQGRGYDPNQPRVAAGHPDGGQWTSVGATHARTVEPSFESADQRTFTVGNTRDNARYNVDVERNFALANYISKIEQPEQASFEIQQHDVGTGSQRRRYAELGRLSPADELAVEQTTQILTNVLVQSKPERVTPTRSDNGEHLWHSRPH